MASSCVLCHCQAFHPLRTVRIHSAFRSPETDAGSSLLLYRLIESTSAFPDSEKPAKSSFSDSATGTALHMLRDRPLLPIIVGFCRLRPTPTSEAGSYTILIPIRKPDMSATVPFRSDCRIICPMILLDLSFDRHLLHGLCLFRIILD